MRTFCTVPTRGFIPVLVGAATVLSAAVPAAPQDTFTQIDQSYRTLVAKAGAILEAGGDCREARSYLKQARSLAYRTPRGTYYLPRSLRGDYYWAAALCCERASASDGAKLFRTILANRGLSASQASAVHDELQECSAEGPSKPSPSRVPPLQQDGWRLDVKHQKSGMTWGEPLRLEGPSRLRLLPWSAATTAMQAVLSLGGGPKLHTSQQRPFLVTGARAGIPYLERLGATVLRPYYDYLSQQIGVSRGSDLIYVFVARDESELAGMTLTLYRLRPSDEPQVLDSVLAYSDPESATMMARCGEEASNCTSFAHELFHLLNSAIFEDAPWWLHEGMAELFESGTLTGGEFHPKVSWRKKHLQADGVDVNSLSRLLRFSKNDPKLYEPPEAATTMARAYFFCQYLDSRDKLWAIYYDLRDRPWQEAINDPPGIATIKKHLNAKTLDTIAADFKTWLENEVLPVEPSTPGP